MNNALLMRLIHKHTHCITASKEVRKGVPYMLELSTLKYHMLFIAQPTAAQSANTIRTGNLGVSPSSSDTWQVVTTQAET